MLYLSHYSSPLGNIMMAGDGINLTGLWFEGQKYFAATLGTEYEEKNLPLFEQTVRWLDSYFCGSIPDFTPPLAPQGSPFRLAVWDILLQIPFGTTMSYGEIAHRLAGQQGVTSISAQAVGGAVGHNPISLIIPCHRVVGSNGSLTGYAGGLNRKASLLRMEGVDMQTLSFPRKGTAL